MWFKYFETSASYWIRPLIMGKAIDRSTLISSLPNRFAGLVCTEVIKLLCVPLHSACASFALHLLKQHYLFFCSSVKEWKLSILSV